MDNKFFGIIVFSVVFFPENSYAYVDPGFLGSLYQILYIFIFGTLAAWIAIPFKTCTNTFKKIKKFFTQKNSK